MILTVIPHDEGPDLGRAYNEAMRRVREDDWVCFIDHDAVFTTRSWYAQLCKAVQDRPDAGLFGVVTNRVGSADQEIPGVDKNNHDMAYHRAIGTACAAGSYQPTMHWDEYVDVDVPGRNWLAGVVMLTSKRAWLAAKALTPSGAPTNGFCEGYLFGVDNEYHAAIRRAGLKTYLLSRVYVYHWFRAEGDDEHVQRLARTHSFRL